MLRIVYGALLLFHGWGHLAWYVPAPADDAFPFRWSSPMFPRVSAATLRKIVTPVIGVVIVTLSIAAFGAWGVAALAGIWPGAAIIGAVLSLGVMALLWHPWLVTGPMVNMILMAGALYPAILSM